MTDDASNPHSGSPLLLRSRSATVPPDAEAIAEEEVPAKSIRLIPGDRNKDIVRAEEEAKERSGALAAARVERKLKGRTGTGLVVEDIAVIDPTVEALRALPDQMRFVQEHLDRIVEVGDTPCDEESSARITVALMERTDRLTGRDIAVVMRVLRGHAELEPILLRAAVQSIAQAHERWELKRLAAEANAPQPADEPMDDVELDGWVLEAIEHFDRDVDDGQIPATHPGALPPAPLLSEEERVALDEVVRSPSPAARHRAQQRAAEVQPAAPEKPRVAPTTRGRSASIHALWITACLLIALVVVVAGYLMRADGQIRAASLERDAAQDETLAEHTESIRSHARTLAHLVPVLAEKDVEILDLTQERDNYAQLAVDSQEAIQALDRRVGGQVGSLSREISETRSDLRRKLDEQARQLEELRARLAREQPAVDETPAP